MEEPAGAADRGILRNRAFLALWAAQILSQVAANATTFALIVLVGELTKSNTSSSILILLAILPAVVFGVFAGVVVDRTDRKRVLVVTNALRAGAVLPLLVLGESASAALLCLTVPKVAPPTAAGRIGVGVAGAAVAQTIGAVGEAFTYLRAHTPVVWSLLYIALTYMLVAVAGALAPGFVREVLGLGEKNVVVLVAPAGLGVVVGLGVLNVIGGRLAPQRAIGTGLIVTAAALVILAAERPLAALFRSATGPTAGFPFFVALVSLTAFVFGVSYAFITVPSMTRLQSELHDQIRGRIFGVLNMLVSVFSFAPLLLVGPVADAYGVAPVFAGGAVACVVAWVGGRSTRRQSRVGSASGM